MNQLKSVSLPSGLLTIGANAFLRCTNLIKIKIPSTVTSIGNQAFRHCTKLCEVCNLSSLQINRTYGDDLNTVNKYGGCVGGYCHYLTTDSSYTTTIVEVGDFVFQLAPTNFALFVGYRGHNKDVVVPGSFTYNGTTYDTNLTISTGAFHNCYDVESITIPKSLDEAVLIDGGTKNTVFWKIILPLSKPIIVYTILMSFTAPWGDYMMASYVAQGDPNMWNVAVGLQQMLSKGYVQETVYPQFCAAAVVVSIPIMILFFKLQNYYVEGVTGGAVKG